MISGAFTVTSERSQLIDFTIPFYFAGITMITKKENTMNQLFSFMTIFEWKVWCIVIFTIFIVALLMLIFDKLNSYHELHKNNKAEKYQDYIWKSFGILALGHLSGVSNKSKDSVPSRILIFGFYFFCFICIIFYQANLAVFLTVSRLSSTITSINDLLESNIEYNLVGSSSTQVFFEDMKSIEEDFVTWMDKFWSLVCNHFGISASEQDGIRFLDFK